MKIIYRGVYAGIPAAALHTGNLAYATDLLVLFISSGVAWIPYHDYPDYQGEKSRVYSPAEWSAEEAEDVTITAAVGNVAFGANAIVNYLVPVGRTFYVTDISFAAISVVPANADNNQQVEAIMISVAAVATLYHVASSGGASHSFNKPPVVIGGDTLRTTVVNRANHNMSLWITVLGYLI